MTPIESLEQILTPRYPAMASAKLAGHFIAAAQKALGAQLPFAEHVKTLGRIREDIKAASTNQSVAQQNMPTPNLGLH